MNIVVKTYSGGCIVRPDTTWEKDNADLYVPEFVEGLSFSPVLFARVSKPGRSVGERFASRYYDAVGCGVLLYPEEMLDGSETGFARASCLDHTSFLPAPMSDKAVLGGECAFRLFSSDLLFETAVLSASMIENAIAEATKYVYLRIGDLVAVELDERRHLVSRSDGSVSVRGEFCGRTTNDFKIVL